MIKYTYTQNKKQGLHILSRDGGVVFSIETNLMSTNEFLNLACSYGRRDARNGEKVEVWDESKTNDCVCENCGSRDVETRMFQNFLTGSVGSPTGDEEDNWCNSCETHTGIVTKKTTKPLLIYKS